MIRLQNSPYFCVLKYARAVKQKVWNEAENREPDWGETLEIRTVRFAYVIFVQITRFSQPRAIPISLTYHAPRALRARKTLMPRFTDFFTDFEKNPTVLQSSNEDTFYI